VHETRLLLQRDKKSLAVHSILDVLLTARHFKNQRLEISCTAVVGTHFKRKVDIQIPLHKNNQVVPVAVESQPAMAKIAGISFKIFKQILIALKYAIINE
jgi:hypothetical protein